MSTEILSELFRYCLEADYDTVGAGASFHTHYEGNTLFLFLQHSSGEEDWMNNLNFRIHPYRDMHPVWYCHAGFLRVFRSLLPHILPLIQSPHTRRMVIVGYSHGGALAVLCHEAAAFHRPELGRRLISFAYGTPRVLAAPIPPAVKARFGRLYLIQNRGDIVTRIPPALLGYRHVGHIISVGKAGQFSPIDAHRPESYLWALSHTR